MLRVIKNARVVTPKELIDGGSVILEDGRIAGVLRRGSETGEALDAGGRYLVPGLVDLHSDAIEAQLAPRPKVEFPVEIAFVETDRLFATSGITTAFHAIPFLDEPGRSVALGRSLHGLISRHRHAGLVRHELHLRCELPQQDSVEAVLDLLAQGGVGLVALMDHRPGQGKYRDLEWFRRLYLKNHGEASEEDVAAAWEESQQDSGLDTASVHRVAQAAEDNGAMLASHDDDTPERVEFLSGAGVTVSEFPVDKDSARRARELGLTVCMGAPNVVRGGSHGGSVSATEAIRSGLVDALCSDYHPPSLLRAAFRLVEEQVLPLPNAIKLVSSRPAGAAALPDLGRISEGCTADLVLVGERLGLPFPTRAIVDGKIVTASYDSTFDLQHHSEQRS